MKLAIKGIHCLVFLIAISQAFPSCNPVDEFYNPVIVTEKYHDIPEKDWHYLDSIPFSFEISDTLSTYNLHILIHHTRTYPHRNLWLRTTTITPSEEIQTRRNEVFLSNPAGYWFGTETGEMIFSQQPLNRHQRFREKGVYTLWIRHDLRRDHLRDIRKIGVKLERNRN
jgi:gliding motility-associated lipoprotein GldH